MKVFKLEVLLIDGSLKTIEDANAFIDNAKYPNGIVVDTISCREAEIGEFTENHPLNAWDPDTVIKETNRLFPPIVL